MKSDMIEIKALPGPKGLPLFGNLLAVRLSHIHLDFERWAQQYGDTFKLRFGTQWILMCAKPDTLHALLRDRPQRFRRPRVTERITQEMGGLPGVFNAEGEAWRTQRRMVMAGFAPSTVKNYFPVLQTVAQRLRTHWGQMALQGQVIDLSKDLKHYAGDIVANLAFGQDLNSLDTGRSSLQTHIDTVLAGVSRRSFSLFPYWRYLRLPQDRRLERSVAALREQTLSIIATARRAMAQQPALFDQPQNLLQAMIVAAAQEGSGIDDDTLAGNVSTLLIAGEDTTSHSLAWALDLLAQNPAVLAKATQQVRAHLPPNAQCADYSIQLIDGMEYLDACIQEAMRLKPVGPFIPLEAVHDTVVENVRVPKGTVMMCLMRVAGLQVEHVQQALDFKPERWLADNPPDKRLSSPFGSGPRMCPGRYLALLEMKVALVMLLSQFDILCVNNGQGTPTQELMGFVMSPVNLTMRLKLKTSDT